MKTTATSLFLLFLTTVSSGQNERLDDAWLAVNPSALVGKRITTTIALTKGPGASASNTQQGVTMTMAGPAEQIISRVLLVKKDNAAADAFTLEQTVKRVQMTIVSPLGRSVYDSDNAFERDQVTAALGQRYDPYINKPQKKMYGATSKASKDKNAGGQDSYFVGLWSMNLPTLVTESAFQGVMLQRLPRNPAPGTAWVDTIRTDKSTSVNRYQLLTKEGEMLHLALQSEVLPGSAPAQGSSSTGSTSGSSTTNAMTFKGEVTVSQVTGLIEALHFSKQSSVTVNASGRTLLNSTTATVEVRNTLN